jgi:hypothetical protein
MSGIREGAAKPGTVAPLPGLAKAARVIVDPGKANGSATDEVAIQSGPLAFVLVISDPSSAPTDAEVTRLARMQVSAVPLDVAAQTDPTTIPTQSAGHGLAYALAATLPIGLIVLIVALVLRRPRRSTR